MRVILSLCLLFFSIYAKELTSIQLQLIKEAGFSKSFLKQKNRDIPKKEQIIKNDIEDFEKKQNFDREELYKNYAKKDELSKKDFLDERKEKKELKRFASNFFNNANKLNPYSLPIPSNYMVSRADVISINIYGLSSESFSLKVDGKGIINIPQVGEIKVLGLTFEETKKLIMEKVKEAYPSSTSILVNMEEFAAIQVTLSGLVKNPGLYNLPSFSTIKDALIQSGGILNSGSYRNILLKRNGKVIKKFDLYKLVKYGSSSSDTILQSGDIIYVQSSNKNIKLDGEVNIPAIFEIKKGESFKTLFAFASGVKANANKKAIKLKRYENNSIKVYTLSLKQLFDFTPKSGDELYVSKLSNSSGELVSISGNVLNEGELEIPKDRKLSSLLKKQFKYFGKNGIFKKDTNFAFAKIENTSGAKTFNLRKVIEGQEEVYLDNGDEIIIFKMGEFKDIPYFYAKGDVVSDYMRKYNFYEGLRAKDIFSLVLFTNEENKKIEESKNIKENEKIEESKNIKENKKIEESKNIKENKKIEKNKKNIIDEKISYVDRSKLQIKRVENNTFKSYMVDLKQNPNFLIKAYDEVTFFSISQINNLNQASIRGEVFIPNTYDINSNTRIKDLLNLAGGFTKKASKTTFELVRYKIVGDERIREIKTLNLNQALKSNMKILPDDEITIRRIANWYKKQYVEIKGEVKYPGRYAISKGEKLSSLIERAGGFTRSAFVEGSVFTRESVKKLQIKRLKDAMARIKRKSLYLSSTATEAGESSEDKQRMLSSINELESKVDENAPIGRVSINIYYDLKRFKKSDFDINLEDKDTLYIPTINDTVSVVGEVLNQNTFVYRSGLSVEDYINRAGGMTDISDENMIYVVKANGEAIKYEKKYFVSDSVEVFKGDTIVVPLKFDTVSDIRFAKDITSILYQLAVTAASLKTVGAI
ncbi:MAG: SLBB domain-containing protein [Arcobacter sp.]|nr:SLBB domain-containing protein [Arcobacter sp.]